MRAFLKALRSLKLALVLLAYFAVTGTLASILPQGREALYYRETLPTLVASIAIGTGFTDFYRSLLFLVPAFLIFANLSACAAYRLTRELAKPSRQRRHGPDLLHLGLILLIASAVLSQAAKAGHPEDRGSVRLAKGEAVQLPGGRILEMADLWVERYPDGRPKAWVSQVRVWKGNSLETAAFDIRVNHPLRLGGLSIFQSSFGTERALQLIGPSGERRSLVAGERIDSADGSLMLMSVDLATGTALARIDPKPLPTGSVSETDSAEAQTINLGKGSKIGSFRVDGAREISLSGLTASYDPAYPAVLASLGLLTLGTIVTFAQKLGGLKA